MRIENWERLVSCGDFQRISRVDGCLRAVYAGGMKDVNESHDAEAAASAPSADKPLEEMSLAEVGARAKVVFRRLGPAGPLAVIAATLPAVGGIVLAWKREPIGQWIESLGTTGVWVYVVGFAVLAGLAILPTWAQALLGGQAFGFGLGSCAAVAGFAGASMIGYVVARRASGDRVVSLIEEKPKWRAVHRALLGSGPAKTFLIVTLLRVPPNSPFAITNLVLAATRVPAAIYLLATVVGMSPRTIATVYIGSTLVNYGDKSPSQKWFTIGGIIGIVIVASIIGTIAKRAVEKVTQATDASPADPTLPQTDATR